MNELTKNESIKDWYLKNFEVFERQMNGRNHDLLKNIRKNSLSKFLELDFPTTKNEEWKYTDVSFARKNKFNPVPTDYKTSFTKEDVRKIVFGNFDYNLITFINGKYSAELSDISADDDKIIIKNLNSFIKSHKEIVENYFAKISSDDNLFNVLNGIYMQDGVVIFLRDQSEFSKPLQVLYLNGDSEENLLIAPRNLIIAGRNTRAAIVFNYYGNTKTSYFTDAVTELFLEEDSLVDIYKIQRESLSSYHIEKFQAIQKDRSVLNHYNINFGGKLTRNDVNSKLDGENIETHYYGLYLGKVDQHIDNHTFVDHAKPNSISNELYKGILDDNSRGVFNGKIIVRRDAQKTNAYQQNKTVLLSSEARIDSKPQLEIFADDVKCTHGATVGHLDEEAEFYIRSRGVPEELAKSILIRAFAADVCDEIKIDGLKEQINHLIFEELHRQEVSY
ncbi:Fe-S cluster assembly protein SufD [Melioribacter sp. OK-6-Me]|uniref:Fe-S cluster assembly protein SufD n=1 Tax=unclassified Melioribacter TaxID=2627329 RepID=UPI003ED97883